MAEVTALVAAARFLLLDFDGPVCAVFAGHPAQMVAAQLRQMLRDKGVSLPEPIQQSTDPMEIIRNTADIGPDLSRQVDDALRGAERAAIDHAAATPYAREVIVAAAQTGRQVAIVSNNSAEAIRRYLTARRLAAYVHPIIGRAYADPARMKPHPASILAAIAELGARPDECLFVGDSPSDVHAARAAGVPVVGYANKPGKHARLAGADAIITSMADLAAVMVSGERLPEPEASQHFG